MSDHPLLWDTHTLWEQLEPLIPGLSVEVLERTASTNTAILDRARVAHPPESSHDATQTIVHRSIESTAFGRRSIDAQPCLLVAEQQTGGRGRQGRAWRSASGASLTFSLALPMKMADWSGLSLAVGVAVADALDPGLHADAGVPRIGLKWPNDLWLMDGLGAGRKLGGILIETVSAGTCRLAIVGIGLNVLPMEVKDAQTGFACLQEIDAAATAPSTLHRLALPLVLALREFERQGFSAFQARFAARDLLRGHAVRTTQVDVPEGFAQGISSEGALLVQTPSGLKPVHSGDVSVRLNQDAGDSAATAARPPC